MVWLVNIVAILKPNESARYDPHRLLAESVRLSQIRIISILLQSVCQVKSYFF